MKISSIQGGVSTTGYENQIQLEGINFQVERDIHSRVGSSTSREGSLPKLDKFIVTKFADKASAELLKAAVSGKAIPTVTVNFVTTGSNPETYLTYELTDVIVASYLVEEDDIAAIENPDAKLPQKPIEKIALDFTQMQLEFTEYDSGGNAQPQGKILWNVSTGTVS